MTGGFIKDGEISIIHSSMFFATKKESDETKKETEHNKG